MAELKTAILAGGCFWCTEAVMKDVVGVHSVESGYIGGANPDATIKSAAKTIEAAIK